MDISEARRKYKLSKAMERQLILMQGTSAVRRPNPSIIALTKRGLAYCNNEDPYREVWVLTDMGDRIAELLR